MKTILVVDDAATIRLYYRDILEPAGYAIEEAMNGVEGLEKALVNHYDLYIVDINMPQMDGCSFLREVRSNEIEQVPAIMISTEAEQSDYQLASQSGANVYIIKPVKPDELLGYTRCLLGDVAP